MTDAQLCIVTGLPGALLALTSLAIIWQARRLERLLHRRFDSLERILARN